jgi:hypothetical protein
MAIHGLLPSVEAHFAAINISRRDILFLSGNEFGGNTCPSTNTLDSNTNFFKEDYLLSQLLPLFNKV